MFELKNHMETVVKEALKSYLSQNELPCECPQCQADIMAHALNRLPARYYVSLRGEILTNWTSHRLPDRAQIMAEVVRAAQLIASSPSHPIDR